MSGARHTRRGVLIGAGCAALPSFARAQGFAGLGADAAGYAPVAPGRELSLPLDLGPHPEFRTEWWYVTANLRGEDGADYGAQWTLFRQALGPGAAGQGWADPHAWMGHAALTSADAHHFAERLGRGGIGQAGAAALPFRAWIDDWVLQDTNPNGGGVWIMRAAGADFGFDLRLLRRGPYVAQGEDGYSVKSEAGPDGRPQASYYFSQPFFDVEGGVRLQSGEIAVRGRAWLDREWSSQPLTAGQTGWDWLSLHLDSGEKLMGFALRGEGAPFISGSWIAADGEQTPLSGADLMLTPLDAARVAGRRVPVRWRAQVPARGLDVEVAPLNADTWNAGSVPYWEGPVRGAGTHIVEGYLELTGY